MPYASIEDMVLAIGEAQLRVFADHDGDGAIDAPVVQAALDEASSTVDLYLAAVQAVPATPTPALRGITIDLALHQLRQRHGEVSPYAQAAHDVALRRLEQMAAGKMQLTAPADPDDGPVVGGDPEAESNERMWTHKTSTGVF